MKKLTNVMHDINVSRKITEHLVGKHHTSRHRKIVGAGIMAMGVGMVKACMLVDLSIVHYLGDLIGFAFHGLGLVPYIIGVEKDAEKGEEDG